MSRSGTITALAIVAGLVALAYAYESQANAADNAPPLPPPDGGDGSLLDWLGIPWNNSPIPIPESDNTDTGIANPLIDFGEPATMGQPWKVNDYPKYASAIRDTEISNRIPVDLLARVFYQESRFRPDVIAGTTRSPVGAVGIAQFMPATAKDYGLISSDGTVDNRTNPFASIAAAGRYLAALHSMFNDWRYALMAYNWGPGAVRKHIQGGGAPVPLETSQYVAQITADVPIA